MYNYDKDEIKTALTIEQIFDIVEYLGGEPIMKGDNFFISKTICHNHTGEGSYKLYYYDNTKLFKCYTDCDSSFDIFELVRKVKILAGETSAYLTREGMPLEYTLQEAVRFIAIYFGIEQNDKVFSENQSRLQDWKIFDKYEQSNLNFNKKKIIDLKIYDDKILKYLPQPTIVNWVEEGISPEVMKDRGIKYDPVLNGIVIPHYNINNELVGIRERTLTKDQEIWGKYRPAILDGKMYNHPLGFNLYNLNNSKNNIQLLEKAFVFEGEKSPLLYASYFGMDNDISVATCGFNLLDYQVQLLISCGAKEIIIAFDKQFQEEGDAEWQRLIKKLYNIHNKYGSYVQISYLFDKQNLLDYKDSPIDKGKDTFLELFKERIII